MDPATGRPGDEIAAGDAEDVDAAVAAAVRSQPEWASAAASERSAVLHRIGDLIERDAAHLVMLERASTGKTIGQARTEVDVSAAYFRYFAGVLRAHHGRTIDLGASVHAYTRFEPYGVIGVITPWNFPLNQACRSAAPALAVGNAVVLKPSEVTSPSTLHLARLASEAGLPPGLLSVITGTGPEAGQPLVEHPGVSRIAFTGSVATGRRLAAIAADRLIPMTLELGGKSPMVVFADADLDAAASNAANAVRMNAGQVCTATTRLLVEASVHDDVVARVVERVNQFVPGEDYGPMITEVQYRKVLAHLAAASDAGASSLTNHAPFGDEVGPGFWIRPTVYADVDPDLPIAREEVFGPVLVTMPFDDEDDAVRRANDTSYGLFAAVWSADAARGLRVAERIHAGQVSVNGGPLTIETPLGGYKQSGYGREKGLEALHDYAQVKAISLGLASRTAGQG